MLAKYGVKWISVLALLVAGLSGGAAYAAPVCTANSAAQAVQEQVVLSTAMRGPVASAELAAQEQAVLSAALGSSVVSPWLTSQAAANGVDPAVQELVVLSAAMRGPVASAELAAQAAQAATTTAFVPAAAGACQ
jgi:hypothetical protein